MQLAFKIEAMRAADLRSVADLLAVPAIAAAYYGQPRTRAHILEELERQAHACGAPAIQLVRRPVDQESLVAGAAWVRDGIVSYVVSPGCQRQGCGLQLLRAACRLAGEQGGLGRLRASVLRDNRASIRLLEGERFCFVGLSYRSHRAGGRQVVLDYLWHAAPPCVG
ncbi:GNAT family N-acetyltransferase [Eleftheria terrae]|uniref:GNAT family N-acetyltransferase n=1 Tax=Eleftheria terrae TaxID=1597781 RepID=UPI00263ADE75|nr:GNAT family N-acetyltransferase [Eleftheria terrae]WKB52754.1 GNAT family N-acetyltransferase [Eleftheria terrae]